MSYTIYKQRYEDLYYSSGKKKDRRKESREYLKQLNVQVGDKFTKMFRGKYQQAAIGEIMIIQDSFEHGVKIKVNWTTLSGRHRYPSWMSILSLKPTMLGRDSV